MKPSPVIRRVCRRATQLVLKCENSHPGDQSDSALQETVICSSLCRQERLQMSCVLESGAEVSWHKFITAKNQHLNERISKFLHAHPVQDPRKPPQNFCTSVLR